MKFETLYSRTSKGAVQIWTIEVDDENPQYRTHHGQQGGKIQVSEWFTCEAVNVGKSNERTAMEQTLATAKSIFDKKMKGKYFINLEQIDKVEFITPMLAHNWKDFAKKVEYPVVCQPKFDGMRAVISKAGAFTRNGKPWLTIPHIVNALAPVFEKYPDIVFDGELYNHDFHDDFDKISSLVKKKKPTPADLIESAEKVQFWCYDLAIKGMDLTDRGIEIGKIFREFNLDENVFKHVIGTICEDSDDLDFMFDTYVSNGYEGQMIRICGSFYEFKRSGNLLKRKDFIDSEYRIIEVGEGNGNRTGMAGFMILEREDGVQFNSNIKGSRDFLKELFYNKENLVGKFATVKYFNLTPSGIPRFPYVIKIRDGVGVD